MREKQEKIINKRKRDKNEKKLKYDKFKMTCSEKIEDDENRGNIEKYKRNQERKRTGIKMCEEAIKTDKENG